MSDKKDGDGPPPFVAWIAEVVCDPRLFMNGADWAKLLVKPAATIERWLEGDEYPSPADLDAILVVLRNEPDTTRLIRAFNAIAEHPIDEVAPGISSDVETLDEYLTQAFQRRMEFSLKCLPADEQREILRNAHRECNRRILKERPSGKWYLVYTTLEGTIRDVRVPLSETTEHEAVQAAQAIWKERLSTCYVWDHQTYPHSPRVAFEIDLGLGCVLLSKSGV